MHTLLLAAALVTAPLQDTTRVVFVATTDVHGYVTDRDYLAGTPFAGGLVRAATVIDSLRARYPGRVVVADAGDLIQGSPFATYFATRDQRETHPILDAMNQVGYDVATPGNHEFNFGVPFMRRALASAAFPYVSANIRALPSDSLLFQPYVTLRRGDVRIAVTGFTTPGVMVWDRDHVRGRVRVEPVERAAARTVADMRKDADVAIVLVHSGMGGRASYDTTGVGDEDVAARFAALPQKPDLVLVGHSHREMRDSVIGGVHFVQPRNWAQQLSVVHLTLVKQRRGWKVAGIRGELVPLATVPPSPRLQRAVAGYDADVRKWVGEALGLLRDSASMRFARAMPTPLVQFINEVQRRRAGTQLASTAAFTTRLTLGPGPISLATIAALYPYENTLRAVKVSGAQLKAYLEQSARYFVATRDRVVLNDSIPGYSYDMVLGVDYAIDLTRPVGDRITELRFEGRRVEPSDSFTLALNSYRQTGGGGFDMLKDAPVVYDRGESVRDLLVDAVRENGGIDPARFRTRNWRIVPELAEEQVIGLFTAGAAAAEASGGKTGPARAARPRAPGDSVFLRLITMNDFHGQLEGKTYDWSDGRVVGGAAVLKAHMDSAAAQCRCPSLRLDGGDEMQGTLLSNLGYGRSTVAVLNAMGLDGAAIGNHELDWSADTLASRIREAKYPWLAANIVDSSTGRRPAWATPWTIIEKDGLRIGLVGYITTETKTAVKPIWVRGLGFPGGAAAIRGVLDSVKAERPDAVIIVAHAGDVCREGRCDGETAALARELGPGVVDAIVSGHTHQPVTDLTTGTPIIQARSSGRAIGVIDLVRRLDGSQGAHLQLRTPFADEVTPDRAVAAVVARETEAARAAEARVIAASRLPLARGSGEEGGQHALGNLIADALRVGARADVGLINNTGIRADLPAGELTYGALYAVQPFGNTVSVKVIPGRVLLQMLERVVQGGRPGSHVSGITVTYDPSRKAGKRIREVRFTDGRKFDPKADYTLAAPDFLQTGGSGYTMLAGYPEQYSAGVDVEVLVQYLRRLPRPFDAPETPRIVPVQ
jgi:2',3'-cyclic-nucleotide 2'-phosphodiesterase (5'-nucleotidase family)